MHTTAQAQRSNAAADTPRPVRFQSARRRLAGLALAAGAVLTAGVVGTAATASATGYVPCPSGYACLYDSSPNTGGYQGFYNYGSYNLSGVTGTHRFTNAQTGGAKAYLCNGYNGTGSCQLVPAGTTVTRDFGPINSVYLSA